jgi:TetR/AcrR family fatty acid metabolism transcriptional regulator
MFSQERAMVTARKEEKRSRILGAAVRLFAGDGFYRTRIGDIAKAANVATGTVYTYFESKEKILDAIFEDSMERFLALGKEDLAGADTALERLRRIVELHLTNLGRDRELATVFQIELRHSARFMDVYSRSRQLREYFSRVAAILEQGKAEGTIRKNLDSWFATKALFGILDEAATNWVLSDRNYRLTSDTDRIVDFALNGLTTG